MSFSHRTFLGVVAAFVAITVMPALAEEPAARHIPTEKDPLRFTGFAINLQGGRADAVDIVIERWSTDEERKKLIALVATATELVRGQDELLKALESTEPRTGFMKTPKSLGWSLKYAHEDLLADGTRRIVLAADKPITIWSAARTNQMDDYPFSLVELRFPPGKDEGEGKLLAQTSISTKDGKMQIELYGQEATRLKSIKALKPKGEKP